MTGATAGCSIFIARRRRSKAASAKSRILTDNGCRIETLDRDGVARGDPALAPVKETFAGALYAPDDESGDCRMFARNMGHLAQGTGRQLLTSTPRSPASRRRKTASRR